MQKLLRHGEKFISFRIYIYQARSMVFLKWGRGGEGQTHPAKKRGVVTLQNSDNPSPFWGGGAYL